MKRWLAGCLAAACAWALSGCSSVLTESAAAGAGIASGSIAGAVTEDAGVAAAIGIGVQAGARAAVQLGERRIHHEVQQQIAEIAGPLEVGQVKPWRTVLSVPLEAEESGRVTVSRVISAGDLDCKEIIIAVDRSNRETLPASQFYVASICRNGSRWSWASAEPATERWSSLQ
jgi:hypothetical protein